MSVDYFFSIATQRAPEELSACLAQLPEFERFDSYIRAPGLTSVDVHYEDGLSKELFASKLGFAPDVWVAFRPAKFDLPEHGMLLMAIAVDALLRRFPGDAVFSRENEDVLALRRAGELTLNGNADFWTMEHQAQIRAPHRLAPLPPML